MVKNPKAGIADQVQRVTDKTEVKLVWVATCPVEIKTVDDSSRLSTRRVGATQ
jgi:hypothetical protein